MKRITVTGLAILTVLLASCGIGAKEPTPTPMPEQTFAQLVSVTGEAVPAEWATVSAQMSGTATKVLVEPGDEVKAGAPLVQLDPTDAELAVRRAEVRLEEAKARMALLKARPRPEEIAVARAEVAAAEAAVAQANARRDQLLSGVLDAEIAAAEAQLTSAQADRFAAYERHEQTMECYNVTLPDGTEKDICPLLGPTEEQARFQLQASEERLESTRSRLETLKAEKGDQIRAAKAAVQSAEEQKEAAEAQLEQLKVGASEEEIAAAQASVQQAQAALEKAKVALERTKIRAPFAGTVGMVRVQKGELVAPGTPLITLGDLSTLRVETTDLDEIDVARVEVGQKVDITLDALPDRVFSGRVARIHPKAESDGGGVNYTAVIDVEELDPAIRWGMTAFVDIEVGE